MPLFERRLPFSRSSKRGTRKGNNTILPSQPDDVLSDGLLGSRPDQNAYKYPVEDIRRQEYPHMSTGIYLDHGGATIYARSAVESFTQKMLTNLYGNPHSENAPAKLSGEMVDHIREKTLKFLGADPDHFDLIFVANATAGIKLVAEAFRDLAERSKSKSFWYGYHKDCHTSLVGIREFAKDNQQCFESDEAVEDWLRAEHGDVSADPTAPNPQPFRAIQGGLGLFAYPGQSNMTGRRLPLSWVARLRRQHRRQNIYTLFDAAALAMTSPLDHVFRDVTAAPDFTCLSLYKIFGFPDLGALVVRKDSGHILALRRYFGGGTVSIVSVIGSAWHHTKALDGQEYSLHDGVEDGTLPFHSILALGEAIDVHKRLYGSMSNISRHTSSLARYLYGGMSALRHINGQPVCYTYTEFGGKAYGDPFKQGATIAFNVLDPNGSFVGYEAVEKLANERGIYLRSGSVCCPGGMVTALGYEPWELDRVYSSGHRCGGHSNLSVINQLPTGIVRVSLGAMSTRNDVDSFLGFLRDTFAEPQQPELVFHQLQLSQTSLAIRSPRGGEDFVKPHRQGSFLEEHCMSQSRLTVQTSALPAQGHDMDAHNHEDWPLDLHSVETAVSDSS